MTGGRYRNEILRPTVVTFAAAIGDELMLMEDTIKLHRANLVDDFLFEEGIIRMEYRSCSTNMNPVEPVWDILGRRVCCGVKSQDLGGQFTGQNVKLGGHQTCLSINRLWHELCDMLHRLVGTTAPGHHDCSIQE
ncbi:transposable element Tcb2 transposase [Trichonephila clavipes]|nr:transposable element Tcb2 transposase [Trichonephila clavipes]